MCAEKPDGSQYIGTAMHSLVLLCNSWEAFQQTADWQVPLNALTPLWPERYIMEYIHKVCGVLLCWCYDVDSLYK